MKRSMFKMVFAVSSMLLSASAFADQVFFDDVIVQGSQCVGMDCVNGESFGEDTLRLKENNLRIHFQDTSNSAAFPTNDWRIIVNESANGGDNYFSIEDSSALREPFKIEAGARDNAIYIGKDGKVGLGTNTPEAELHVEGAVKATTDVVAGSVSLNELKTTVENMEACSSGSVIEKTKTFSTNADISSVELLPDSDTTMCFLTRVREDSDCKIKTVGGMISLHGNFCKARCLTWRNL